MDSTNSIILHLLLLRSRWFTHCTGVKSQNCSLFSHLCCCTEL